MISTEEKYMVTVYGLLVLLALSVFLLAGCHQGARWSELCIDKVLYIQSHKHPGLSVKYDIDGNVVVCP